MTDRESGAFSVLHMFWGNLAARPLRGLLSVLAIAIQVVLVLMIVGMTSGVLYPTSVLRTTLGLPIAYGVMLLISILVGVKDSLLRA